MWKKGWRQHIWSQLDQVWDILIIGGGITGAGILRRAVEEGYSALLVEAGDFSSGTSSRSSKLIHGGFRYLRNKQYNVTRESVREREWLLKEARELVTPLGFLMPCPHDSRVAQQYAVGVVIYDLLAPKWQHHHLSRSEILTRCPQLESQDLNRGFLYYDAAMDDSRVILRLLGEAVAAGGSALNYTRATRLLKDTKGTVRGAAISDQSPAGLGEREVQAKVVINAAGPWSDDLRAQVGGPARLRRLRGSHLVFARERLDLHQAITLRHPLDGRAMFAIPWEGVTLVGTTDLDHVHPLSQGEPYTTPQEIDYILAAARATFPSLNLSEADILSTFSGLRPIISTGHADPSKESRAHVVWEENGLITITGGKYTTFRLMAEAALRQALPRLPYPANLSKPKRYFTQLPHTSLPAGLSVAQYNYLSGRYGEETLQLLNDAAEDEMQPIHHLPNVWAELLWAARSGAVEHLDDLLLRRVRIGLTLPDGAAAELDRVRAIVQPELGWSNALWDAELARYYDIYAHSYSPTPLGF
jgi:glycerol-3-phosphate dehydrogenase